MARAATFSTTSPASWRDREQHTFAVRSRWSRARVPPWLRWAGRARESIMIAVAAELARSCQPAGSVTRFASTWPPIGPPGSKNLSIRCRCSPLLRRDVHVSILCDELLLGAMQQHSKIVPTHAQFAADFV